MSKARLSVAAALAAIAAVNAAEITVEQAGIAAESFVSADAIGSSVLSGRSVAGVSRRDGLWIVALAPSGHVIFSGSDLVEPVVGFSKNDFVEPDPESPAFAVLEGANASVATAEAQDGGTRHARWTKLLGDVKKSGLLRADNPSSGAVVVEPFLAEHYNQWQPYNDYAPVHEPDEDKFAGGYEPYRGRCPCGCVATAAAQIFHCFKWPARIDSAISYNHVFKDDNGVGNSFPIRFDGHEPIYWNAISNEYAYSYRKGSKTCYDLRGGVDETVRYPIARLILWCDVLAHMDFESSGSSSSYDTIASNVSDWYTPGHWVEVSANADYSQVVSDLQAGVPLQVSLNGHQVVAHGWAQDGTSKYIYLNYGWGGSSDGYYNLDNSTIDLPIQAIFVGHYPRAKPQIDPLPAVCGTSLSLNWHFPDFYTNRLSGFTVSLKKTATEASTFNDDFTSPQGVSDAENGSINNGVIDRLYVGSNSDYGADHGPMLIAEPLAFGVFTFTNMLTLTSSSVLSFDVRSINADACTYGIQASFNNESWTSVTNPPLATSPDGYTKDSGWQVMSVDLSRHAGKTVRFRVCKEYVWGEGYYDNGVILLDNFTVSEVLESEAPTYLSVEANKRSVDITGLEEGSAYSFDVTPNIAGAIVDGEKSDPMATKIAGEMLVPVESETTVVVTNSPVFSTVDATGTWSYTGTAQADKKSVKHKSSCSITVNLPGVLTADSMLSFKYKAQGTSYSSTKYDTFSAVFRPTNGTDCSLWSKKVASSQSSLVAVTVPLAEYSGETGSLVLTYSHKGAANTSSSYGGTLSDVMITNVVDVHNESRTTLVPQVLPALGTPEILSVSAVSEGFYGECWTNITTFSVVCSETIETLEARPSHLSLVRDEDVSVSKVSDGKFKVCVTPSGIDESNFRSRMILTLVGTDSNGTKCYKDLSLRFSQVEPKPTEVHVEATMSSGDEFSVEIPYAWIEDNGLAPSGSDAAAYEAAVSANADADSDGLPNWAEYVCGTSPTDPAEKLVAFITMVNGEPVVTYSPGDSQIADGFKAVIKGTTELSAALSTWEVVTETRTSTCRFFRVEIVPEN
ncbi:MAG: C10 family peptidase [Kiritimatiellae bacterium]|nr:C10 family peptidase [Kiritimatiellia bacterium]